MRDSASISKKIPRWISVVLVLIIAKVVFASSAPVLNADIHPIALSTISCIYNEQYADAKEEARKIIKRHPGHPAGYFFMAAALDSWMATHFSDKFEGEFYRYCDLAVEKGEDLLQKNPNDVWAKFFIGGAEGYKGTYEARFERWITAFRYGWKGVSILMQLQDKKASLVDISYGIGCYHYWRSALMKNLWWMPGVEDRRKEGIDKLLMVKNKGVYTQTAALASLIDIYSKEKRNDDALAIAEQALAQHPRSLVFQFGKGGLLFKVEKYQESRAMFQAMLGKWEDDANENRGAMALCHYWIAKNEFALEQYEACIESCDLMKSIGFTSDTKKIMQKYFSEIETVRKQAQNAMRN